MQLGITYIVHLLVMCCKCVQNARYAQFQDTGKVLYRLTKRQPKSVQVAVR